MKRKYLIMPCVLIFAFFIVIPAAKADFFQTRDLVAYQDLYSIGFFPKVVEFGGCEINACYDNSEIDHDDIMWTIGNFNVKQGIYYLPVPDEHDHGKLVLTYKYKFITEEEKDSNSSDQGIIKLKNIDTEEIYYKKVITSVNAETDWQDVRMALPGAVATKNLQLVFETINDESGLSVLYIAHWRLKHVSQPALSGRITYKVSGKTFIAKNALVALQNMSRTKTYQYTSTDDNGNFVFFPVRKNRRYVVAATLGDKSGLKEMRKKILMGQKRNLDFTLK